MEFLKQADNFDPGEKPTHFEHLFLADQHPGEAKKIRNKPWGQHQ